MNQRVPPPKLSLEKAQKLSEIIEGHIASFDSQAAERIKRVDEARKMHNDDFKFRVTPGTIYQHSNIGVPIIKSVVVSYIAKFFYDLVGDGSLVVTPEGKEDKKEAEADEKYWTWELDNNIRMQNSRATSIESVAVEGTAITKRLWKTDKSYFPRIVRRLYAGDEPVLHPDGSPIQEGDGEIGEIKVESSSALKRFAGIPDRQPVFLMKDGTSHPIPPGADWQEEQIQDSVTHYDNAKVLNVEFSDFICSMTAPCIQDSPVIGHKYEIQMWELFDKIARQAEALNADGVSFEGAFPPGWIVENVMKLKGLQDASSSSDEKTASDPKDKDQTSANSPSESLGEKAGKAFQFPDLSTELMFKNLKLAELSMKFDVDGDGRPEDIIVIWERTEGMVLFVDYLVSVYPDCKTPYTVHRLFPVKNRWYGIGWYEFLRAAQDFIDGSFNRTNYRRSMNSNPAGWIDKSAFDSIPEVWGPGAKFIVKQGRNGANSFGFFVMPALEGVEQKLFEFFISLVQLITGVSSAMQGQVANLPSTATATGIQSIIAEGQKMFAMMEFGLKQSLEEETAGVCRMIQQNVQEKRVFRYTKGADKILADRTPEQIREMHFDVKITINKSGQMQRVDAAKVALSLVQGFVALPPAQQIRMRPIFRQILKGLGFPDADDLLPSIEELKQDQSNDQLLQGASEKIAGAVQKMQAAQLDPSKAITADLMAAVQTLQEALAKPPPAPIEEENPMEAEMMAQAGMEMLPPEAPPDAPALPPPPPEAAPPQPLPGP